MRLAIVLAAVAVAGCAAKSPLDLIPPEELMMIEAADRLKAQSPDALQAPLPAPDLDAQYRAALIEAGLVPPVAQGREVAAAPEPARRPGPPQPRPAAPAGTVSPRSTDHEPAPAVPAETPAPITVDEMLARVREQAGAKR